MKQNLFVLFIFIITVFIFSCKKENKPASNNNPFPDSTVTSYKKLLIREVDYLGDSSTSPVNTQNYHFDNQNRLQSTVISQPTGTHAIAYDSTIYYYNGEDTLPYKYIYYSWTDTSANVYVGEFNFLYDNTGKLDSVSNLKYNYLPGIITIKETGFPGSGSIGLVGPRLDTILYNGDNTAETISHYVYAYLPETQLDSFEYTTLQNPYNLINIYRYLPLTYPYYFYYKDMCLLNKNAIAQIRFLTFNPSFGNSSSTKTFVYDNITDNLPGKVTIYNDSVIAIREYYYYN